MMENLSTMDLIIDEGMSVGMKALVRVSGGTGNQFFQIGFGNFLSEQLGFVVNYDVSSYSIPPDGSTPRVFHGKTIFPKGKYVDHGVIQIEKLRAVVDKLRAPKILKKVVWSIVLVKRMTINRQILHYSFRDSKLVSLGGSYFTHVFIGDWQNAKFLTKDFISSVNFELSCHSIINYFDNSMDFIAVHIRRGDYLDVNSIHKVLDSRYYEKAINHYLKKNPTLRVMVFSDDENSAGKLLDFNREIVFASNLANDVLSQIYLMSKMRYLVIANSSFSFMAALLGETNKSVVAPSTWCVEKHHNNGPLLPSHWKIT